MNHHYVKSVTIGLFANGHCNHFAVLANLTRVHCDSCDHAIIIIIRRNAIAFRTIGIG